jgi:peptidyl-prolyl cis-trans isomerase D
VLKFIRRNKDALWVKLTFGAIVVVFIGWGVGAVGIDRGQVVASVNGEPIDPAEYKLAYDGMVRFYQNLYKDALTPEIMERMNIPGRTVDQLISSSLMRQEAERLGLAATDSEVRDSISSTPAFQIGGAFNRDAYVETLRRSGAGLTPSKYEESVRREILVNKLRDLITAGVRVSEADVRQRFEFDNEKVNLNFVRIDAKQFAEGVEVKEEDVKAHYDAHSDQFREPERVEIEYILFPTSRYEGEVEVADAEVQEYYDGHQAEFTQEEQARARHILIRVEEGADEATKSEARKRADAALARVKAGEDFGKVATETSEDSSAARGGDLGFFKRGMMVPPFEEAAFGLQPGQTSEIVETQFGLHIIKLEEHTPAGTKTLADAREQIVAKLKQQRTQDLVRNKATSAHTEAAGGKSLQDIAAAGGLEVKTAGPVAKTERVAGVSGLGLVNAAFALGQPGIGPVVSSPEGQVVFRLVKKTDSFVPELAAIRERVEAAARDKLAADKAKAKAEELLAAAKEKGLVDAAQGQGLTVEESGPVRRSDTKVGEIGIAPDLAKQAFELTAESPVAPVVYDISGSSVVVALKERIPADETAFAAAKDDLIKSTTQRLENEVLTDFVKQLRSHAAIEIGHGFQSASASAGAPPL